MRPYLSGSGLWFRTRSPNLTDAARFPITRSVRRFRRRPPKGFLRIGLAVGLPLALSLLWAFIVLIGIPQKVGAPLSALLMGMPDLGYLLLISVVVGLAWALAKSVWAALTLRPRPAV